MSSSTIKGSLVKIFLFPLITLLFITATVNAKTIYVTDDAKYTLRRSESTNSKILKMLPSGTALTVLSEDQKTGYSQVRTSEGVEGFIVTRYTLNKPVSKWYLDRAIKKIDSIQQERDLLNKEFIQLKSSKNLTESSSQSLVQENEKLNKELTEIRKTAANAIQTKRQRDQLQERFISVERKFQQIKRENQTLEDSTNQDWFLYGGFLSLLGVVLGIILPKLSRHHKRSSSWDTF